jgi:hypothetical protein
VNQVHFVKIIQSGGIEETFIKASKVEDVIRHLENKMINDDEGLYTEWDNALKASISRLKELLPK